MTTMTPHFSRIGFALVGGVSLLSTVSACATAVDDGTTSPSPADATAGPTTPSATSSGPADSQTAGSYTDGSYTATGSYQSPGGEESVTVTLTLSGGVITDVEVISNAQNPNSQRFQGEFISEIAGQVVGRSIDDIAVSKVAGSSLTSGGFNAAVDAIRDDAS